jgi:hypothetical protein
MKTKFFNSLSPLSFRRGVGVRLLFVLFLSLPFGDGWGGALMAQHGTANVAAPSDAASTQTWTVGSSALVWSDRIVVSACNKEVFTNSYIEPQCRSYTAGGQLLYYYNWPYVNANQNAMCPSPWRVPTKDDFTALMSAANPSTLVNAWGYGGYVNESGMNGADTLAYYWSSMGYGSAGAYELYYYSAYLYVGSTYKYYGQPVRCVKGRNDGARA